MEVHYSRLYRYLILGLGIFNVVAGFISSSALSLIIGVIFTILGLIAMKRVYLRVGENVITLYSLIGPLKREFPYKSPADITVDKARLLIRTDGGVRSITAPSWMVDQVEWARVQDNFLPRTDAR